MASSYTDSRYLGKDRSSGTGPLRVAARMVQTVRILKTIGEAVMFRHTLFSLPFVATAVLLESGGHPPVNKTILIFLAAAAARNAANALNRVIDAAIDGRNPRTAHRHLPQRALSKKALLIFALVMGGILTVCAALLGPLCVILLPPACILIAGYSFSKRFTCLCHYWLGAACACAPMGAFIALSGHLALRYIVLAAAHALWVAGFDILYAIQDIAFDRREDLHSIPARFGAARARICAILSHLGTLTGLFLVPRFWPVSTIYLSSVCAAAALLAAEHLIALGKTERHIRVASYSINEILPLVILAGTVADFWLR